MPDIERSSVEHDCPNPEYHGNPFRYCACGWMEEPVTVVDQIVGADPRLQAATAAAEAWLHDHGLHGYMAASLAGDILSAADRTAQRSAS